MSARSRKNKKKRKPSSARRKANKNTKRRKNLDAEVPEDNSPFRPGEFVSWEDEKNNYVEGCVLEDSVTCMSVLTQHYHILKMHSSQRSRTRYSHWRDRVDIGDILEYETRDSEWIFCVVRGLQGLYSSSTVVVIEPVFVGRCLSVPLKSLKLRKIPRLPPEIMMLKQSGFAFFNENSDPINWPPYNPKGHPTLYFRERRPVAEDYSGCNGTILYKLRAHPIVPKNVCLVRDSHGALSYMLETEIGQRCTNSKLHLPEKVCLGTLSLPFDDSETKCKDELHLARQHLKIGHVKISAMCALLDTNLKWQEEGTKTLAQSLLNTICTDLETQRACHPVGRIVWQHNYTDLTRYGSKSDLLSLSDSLTEMDLPENDENIAFRNNICIWQMYPELWVRARRFILDSETYLPLHVTLDSISKSAMEFTVNAMISGENPFAQRNADKQNFADMTTIMSAFTPGMWPPPPESNVSSKFLQAGWHYDSMNAFGKSRSSNETAEAMLEREGGLHANKLHSCVTHKAKQASSDSEYVAWNVLEGPVFKRHFTVGPVWESVSGGILVEGNSFTKMESVAHLIREERQSRSQFGSTLIVTKPTLLYEWYGVLETMGIPCFLYHGAKRHEGHQLNIAVETGRTIITTAFSMCNVRDRWRLFSINAWESPYRVILDNLMGDKPMPSGVVSAITSTNLKHVWVLEKELNRTVVGTAVALLKIRPFFKRARWDRDFCTELEQRQYTRVLLSTSNLFTISTDAKKVKPLWDMRYALINNLCLCNGYPNVSFGRCVPYLSSIATHDSCLQKIFDMFKAKHFQRWEARVCYNAEPTVAQFAKLTECLVKTMYGIIPRLSKFTQRLATGEYTTDHNVFERRMNQRKQGAQIKKAKLSVKKLLAKDTIEETCPICMEGICLNTTESALGQTVFDMTKCTAVGTCGHMLCGACADEIQRVAMENCANHANDYGMGDNTVNRPRCPLCRDPWDTGAPPLLVTNSKSHALQSDGKGIYSCRKDIVSKNRNTKASGLLDLQKLLRSLKNSKKIVIVCQSSQLADWLAEVANEGRRTKAVVIGCQKSIVSRRNALRNFRCDAEINQLYISAKLCSGLSLCCATEFIIADRLHADYTKDVLYMLYSSWNGRVSPVEVYTMKSRSCSADGEGQLSELLGTQPSTFNIHLQDITGTGAYTDEENEQAEYSLLAELPKTRLGYKRLLHNAFGMAAPPPKAPRAPTIVSVDLESLHSSSVPLQSAIVDHIFQGILADTDSDFEEADVLHESIEASDLVGRTTSAPATPQLSGEGNTDSESRPAVGLVSVSGAVTV